MHVCYRRIRRLSLLALLCFVALMPACRALASQRDVIAVHRDRNLIIAVAPPATRQGGTVTVFVNSRQALREISVHCFSVTQNTFKVDQADHPHLFRTFIGVSALQKPGNYTIRVSAVTTYGTSRRYTIPLTVKPADFLRSRITIPQQKTGLLQSKSLSTEATIIGAALKKITAQPFFGESFTVPANGQVSSLFGTQRIYNNGIVAWYHKGIDIANRLGTPVVAATAGTVAVSEDFEVHGRTVIIDHGHSVITIYNHLDSITVTKGAVVKKGDVVGFMGSTGISTGPHLHFGVSVNNVRVDPQQWLDRNVVLDYTSGNF